MADQIKKTTIYLWDLPLRLFHWLLVASIIASYVLSELGGSWLEWHTRVGILILALIMFRIIWGFTGSEHARFRSFLPSAASLRAYLSSNWTGIGHTPLGAVWIITTVITLFIQTCFGLFAVNDEINYYSPLSFLLNSDWNDRLTYWHSVLFNVLLYLIILHILAIAYYFFLKRKNLILPMIIGNAETISKYQSGDSNET